MAPRPPPTPNAQTRFILLEMDEMQKSLQEFFTKALDEKLASVTAELRELRADLEEVKRARSPAARPRDPAQNQIGGTGDSAPHLHASLPDADDPEDHLQGHADEVRNQQYVPRGEELPRGLREDRRDDAGCYERRRDRGDVKELDLQFAPRGNGVPRGHHEIHRDLEGAHGRRFRRDGDHYRDRRHHGDNFDPAYPPRGYWLPHHLVHPHDDDAYHEPAATTAATAFTSSHPSIPFRSSKGSFHYSGSTIATIILKCTMCRIAIRLALPPCTSKITLLYGCKHTSVLTGR